MASLDAELGRLLALLARTDDPGDLDVIEAQVIAIGRAKIVHARALR